MSANRVIFWVAWGADALAEVRRSFEWARHHIEGEFWVVTDDGDFFHDGLGARLFEFQSSGFFRKAEVLSSNLFPQARELLFLDSDTVVLSSVSLGFEKAQKFGLAVAGAPTYLL